MTKVIIVYFFLACSLFFESANAQLAYEGENYEVSPFFLRDINNVEGLADFQQIAHSFRELYGPLEFKERRFNFNFEDWVAEIEARIKIAKSEAEIFGLYYQFLAKFDDGHVGLSFINNSSEIKRYKVPVFLTPVEDRALVAWVDKEMDTSIAVGDELIKVDGVPVFDYLPTIKKYYGIGNDLSLKHLIYKVLYREPFVTEWIPKKNRVFLTLKKEDGTEYTESLVWRPEKNNTIIPDMVTDYKGPNFYFHGAFEFNNAAGSSLLKMSQAEPFFASSEVIEQYGLRRISANDEFRKKYKLKKSQKPNIYAYMYNYKGKNILLVRNYTYWHRDLPNSAYMKAYQAIFDQYEPLADVLVLDQTHNGGGSYCEEFFTLFIQEEKPGTVQSCNVDRKWIQSLGGEWINKDNVKEIDRAYMSMSKDMESDYENNLSLTSYPFPIFSGEDYSKPNKKYTWKKPMLVLTDELAGSCGDAFPKMIKTSKRSKIFGQRTMGLGGNVEEVAKLVYSQGSLRLTRGLFTTYKSDNNYPDSHMVENNGVVPDYEYNHTVTDFRKGFVDYVEKFSQKAVEQIVE
ncbi:MAG: PDZ domain-containing protein [Bdellovibrionaceae bacterium]|nr:PDZ domain-containing protein [Pseudobdellovibrionaceae bacterium]